MRRKLALHLPLVFSLGFAFIFTCFVGLPADFNADHLEDIQSTRSLGYGDFIRLIVNPLTPAWFYPPDTPQMGYLRPLQYLLLKLYFDTLGYELYPFHVTAAVGFGLLSAVFFTLILLVTRSLLWSWLGVLLYASFPTNFYLLASIFCLDFQYYVSLLTIFSLTLFGVLTFKKPKSMWQFSGLLLGWVILVWLAIKLKSTEKMLPFISLGFLVTRIRFIRSRISGPRVALLLLVISAMMLLVVPLRPFEAWVQEPSALTPQLQPEPSTLKDKTALSFKWENVLKRTFYIPGGEFPFATVHRREIPRSLTENYGFFLGWLLWLGFVLIPFMLSRAKKEEPVWHGFWLLWIWFASMVIGFGSGTNLLDGRLLNFGYVPSVLLLFAMVGAVERQFFSAEGKRRRAFRWIISGLVIYTCATNFGFFSKLLLHFGGIQDALVRIEGDIYRDFYGEDPGLLSLYERHQELESRAVVVDWYDLPSDWLERAKEKIQREGKVYFYTRTPDSERLRKLKESGYRITLWRRYDFLEARPLLFNLMRSIEWVKSFYKTRKKREILVYLVE